MKHKFFVVFCQQALHQPKLYQRQAYALKKLAETNTYTIEFFDEQEQAHRFYDERLREISQNKKVSGLSTLKTNLQIKTHPSLSHTQEEIKQRPNDSILDLNQKQQRLTELNTLLQDNKIFKKSSFKPSSLAIDPSLFYEGYFDGCCKGNPGKAGIGYLMNTPLSQRLTSRSQYIGNRTNNQAQMIALILLLGDAYCNGIRNMKVFGDSSLVINIMNKRYNVHNPYLSCCSTVAFHLQQKFTSITYNHISRVLNHQADALANKAFLTSFYHGEKNPKDE